MFLAPRKGVTVCSGCVRLFGGRWGQGNNSFKQPDKQSKDSSPIHHQQESD